MTLQLVGGGLFRQSLLGRDQGHWSIVMDSPVKIYDIDFVLLGHALKSVLLQVFKTFHGGTEFLFENRSEVGDRRDLGIGVFFQHT